MWTRQQYMNRECTHRQYYAQFVRAADRDIVEMSFGVENLKIAFGRDEAFNTIPLGKWDALTPFLVNKNALLRECEDWLSLSAGVCILKEAARQVVENDQGSLA